jgi:glycolate oxidase
MKAKTAVSLVDALVAIVGAENVRRGPEAAALYTDVFRAQAEPIAVVRPASVEALQAVVRATAEADAPMNVRGGGASYTDGYTPSAAGQVLLDLSGLDRIVEVNETDAYVTVEAGVTWAKLKAELDARGLRTPFWGPFSGLVATVGGSMSQNTISHGSSAYGISAGSALAMDVVATDGTLVRTGSAINGGAPFTRNYGPDLTGLFTGDCGALGVKARITLPLLKVRPAHRPISFAFADFGAMHEVLRLVAAERLEDTSFILDGALSQGQIARQDRAGDLLGMALSILKSSPSLAVGVGQLLGGALRARRDIAVSAYMIHYIVEGVDDAEVKARLHRIRQIAASYGREIPATVPAVVRGMPFAPFYNVLGPNGERWVPVHGVFPHSKGKAVNAALAAFFAERQADMKRLGVWKGEMFSTVGAGGLLYELALYWPDAISAYHEAYVPADYLAALPRHPDNPEARAYAHKLKADLIALFDAHGAIYYQLGRAYPYAGVVQGEALDLVRAVKARMDPKGLLAPGVLGL